MKKVILIKLTTYPSGLQPNKNEEREGNMFEIFTATAIHEIDGKYTIIETRSLNELKQDLTRTREQLAESKKAITREIEEYADLEHKFLRLEVDLEKSQKQLTIAREALEDIAKTTFSPGGRATYEAVKAQIALARINTPMPMGEDKVIKKPSIEKLEVSRKRLKELYEKEPSEELLVILEDAFKDEAQPEEG